MLAHERRLRSSEVREVLARGKSLPGGRYLSAKVFYPRASSNATIRSAAVASKKLAKGAVERNRLRRAVYRVVNVYLHRHFAPRRAAQLVFFIRAIPPQNLTSAFASDIEKIFSSIA